MGIIRQSTLQIGLTCPSRVVFKGLYLDNGYTWLEVLPSDRFKELELGFRETGEIARWIISDEANRTRFTIERFFATIEFVSSHTKCI